MNDSSTPNPARSGRRDEQGATATGMGELRSLLLEPVQVQLGELQKRLDNPKRQAEEISRVLPEAIVLRSTQDRKLSTALMPTIEEAVRTSVQRDSKTLVSALFPVMGPAIRKAVSETFRRMVQSFSHTLEQSFSWRGLKWRLEALRTGRPFAEVVLVHSLIYRVEQVFLIHKETGIVLQHVVVESAVFQDPDLVSGMLTAIEDFVEDSFRMQKEGGLETIRVGELTVWVEQGPQAILAGVIRGNAPEELRLVFQDALENIHLEQGALLESFEGDVTPFEAARHHLEACLKGQRKSERQRLSPLLWILSAALLIAVLYWTALSVRDHWRWTSYVEDLRAQEGIVVTLAEKRYGKYHISGLRDPLAVDPDDILSKRKISRKDVVSRWESYWALGPRFVLLRSIKLLNPPETVSLQFEEGSLVAKGFASHQWIAETKKLALAIPGVEKFQTTHLIDNDLQEFDRSKDRIEKQILRFAAGTSRLLPDSDQALQELAAEAKRLQETARIVGKKCYIKITGHADSSGSEAENMILSRKRADLISSFLVSKGIGASILAAVGIGEREPLREELTEEDKEFNRSVTFRVISEERSE